MIPIQTHEAHTFLFADTSVSVAEKTGLLSHMKVICWMLAAIALQAQAISEWAFGGPDHRLHYRTDGRGNGIMDFSSAGYRGGGVRLPFVAAAKRLTPAPGDNTTRIQSVLDKSTGAVVLAAGEYEIAGTLTSAHSGIVLRGEKGASMRKILECPSWTPMCQRVPMTFGFGTPRPSIPGIASWFYIR